MFIGVWRGGVHRFIFSRTEDWQERFGGTVTWDLTLRPKRAQRMSQLRAGTHTYRHILTNVHACLMHVCLSDYKFPQNIWLNTV